MINLAAMVVLYQPQKDVIEYVKTYSNEVSSLYVVDNSDNPDKKIVDVLKKNKSVQYICMNGNQGIAKALNIGIEYAKRDGYTHLMTMDQDSKFETGEFVAYKEKAEAKFDAEPQCILSGISNLSYSAKYPDDDYEYVKEVISSGMIIDIKKTNKIGGFIDELFIDFVDYEFCYRAKKNGYKCFVVNTSRLIHQIGSVKPIDFMMIHFNNHNEHSKVRFYYITRNAIYVMRKYNEIIFKNMLIISKMIAKTILVESNKIDKIVYVVRGIRDALRGRYGKI